MTIDTSNLGPEQQEWLKANPEFLKGLEADIPRQLAYAEASQRKKDKGKAKWQRELESVTRRVDEAKRHAEELQRRYDPELMKINQRFMETTVKGDNELVCPVCMEGDNNNKMNGKPWCIKCNSPLIPKSKVEKWKKLPNVKVVSQDSKMKRSNFDLYGADEK